MISHIDNRGYGQWYSCLSPYLYKAGSEWQKVIKRRLIRLHPMVVLGAVLGVIAFCIQGCEKIGRAHV